MRFCSRCKTLKTSDSFYRRSDTTGLQAICKVCMTDVKRVRRKNPAIRAHNNALSRGYRRSNPSKYRLTDREGSLRRLGIEGAQYNKLFALQGGVCAICKKPETAVLNGRVKNLATDHCHETGAVRGLLCGRCNTALGLFDDDLDLLELAQCYLLYSTNALEKIA